MPFGKTLTLWPGAHAVSHVGWPVEAEEPGSWSCWCVRIVSPKQVHPLPPLFAASAAAAQAGGIRNRIAWCTSASVRLPFEKSPGLKSLSVMNESLVTLGFTSEQW